MNAIECMNCHDILVPIEEAGIRKCFCGLVEMRAVPYKEKHPWLVEVKLHDYHKEDPELFPESLIFKSNARVIKINNAFMSGIVDYDYDFNGQKDSLFAEHRSHIVIAPLDTPGVKVVEEFSNRLK